MAGNTVRLHRVFATKPEKQCTAPSPMPTPWRRPPPNGFTCHVYELGCARGRQAPHVLHQLQHRHHQRLRWRISGTGAEREAAHTRTASRIRTRRAPTTVTVTLKAVMVGTE